MKSSNTTELWQPLVAYRLIEKYGFLRRKSKSYTFTFVCDKVFLNKDQALLYFPKFLQDLIRANSLPSEVIVNGAINEDLIVTLVQKVSVSAVEFEGKNDL